MYWYMGEYICNTVIRGAIKKLGLIYTMFRNKKYKLLKTLIVEVLSIVLENKILVVSRISGSSGI